MNYKKLISVLTLSLVLIGGYLYAGMEDRMSDIVLKSSPVNRAEFPEISAPSGNPTSNTGWLYVKDNSGTSDLYFEDDAGTVVELTATAGTAWSSIGNAAADSTIVFDDDEITVLTFADVDEDMFNIQGLGAFGDVSIVRIESKTGNPTDGTVLEVVSHDANVDPLVVTSSAQAGALIVGQDGNTTINGDLTVTGTSTLATWTISNLNATTATITSATLIQGPVILDDGTGASPSFLFKDATDETATFSKADSGNLSMTIAAADSFQVLTGNLRVGNGSPGTASMDGEDAYIEGELEVDGAIQLDGDLTLAGTLTAGAAVVFNNTLALSENVTFAVAADEYMQLDADTIANTTTSGVLDIDVQSATNENKAITLVYQLEDGATAAYGLYINLDDDATGGETFHGIYLDNSAGTTSVTQGITITNKIDYGIVATLGAVAKALTIDATVITNTGTTGLVDVGIKASENGQSAINVELESTANGAGELVHGLYVNLDDGASNATAEVRGLSVVGDGTDGTGLQNAIVVSGANMDAGLYLQTGYLRVGTGTAPDQSLGDDDGYLEGTLEVNGNIYADGNIVGDGATQIDGFVHDVTDGGATNPYTVTIAMCGTTFYNSQAIEFDLPEASTAIGCKVSFAVLNASNLDVDPEASDLIVGATDAAGDKIRSATVGDTVTLQAVSASQWVVLSTYPASTDWTDAN